MERQSIHTLVVSLYNLAMPLSLFAPDALPVTGHFREGPKYAVSRSEGTDDWLLIYTMSGAGRFDHAEGTYIAEPNVLVLLPPGTLHSYGSEPSLGRWELLWAHFLPRLHWHPWLKWPEVAPGLRHARADREEDERRVVGALQDVHRLATSALPYRTDLALNALERLLLWVRLINPDPLAAEWSVDARVQRAMNYLSEHMNEKITLQDLAEEVHLSPSRLAHLFREQVGATPQQFLERHRLERAKQLLRSTPHLVQDVAWQVGYENPFYFTRRFKKYAGCSPSAYRGR